MLPQVWSHTNHAFASEVAKGRRRPAAAGIKMRLPVAKRLGSRGDKRIKLCEVSLSRGPVEG